MNRNLFFDLKQNRPFALFLALGLAAILPALSPLAGHGPAFAQSKTVPVPVPRPALPGEQPLELDITRVEPIDLNPRPSAQPDAEPAVEPTEPTADGQALYPLVLAARLSPEGPVVEQGLVWRIYAERTKEDGTLNLLARVDGGTIQVDLPAANYVIHIGYGLASFTTMVAVERGGTQHVYSLNAGGLRLTAEIANGGQPDANAVKFDLYRNSNGEQSEILLMSDIEQSKLVRVNAGAFSVVARYGSGNAIMRADVTVEPEKLTEATIYHRAAKVTLKLVSEAGGEGLANTEWSVLTPGGDTVSEMSGAFPTLILVEGDYTVIARNQSKIYNRGFSVVSGQDGEVELLATP